MLTSGLGVLSALDAKNQCLEHETYSLMELMDDDTYQRYEQAAEFAALQEHLCVTLFYEVVVPAGLMTSLLSLLGLIVVLGQSRVAKDDFPKSLRNLVILFWMLVVIVALQTYNVSWIMLIPKNMSQEDNPYQSLAAVDRYGNVGDNANLYYLTWISEGLALALLYQVGTACFRAYRRARMDRLTGTSSATDDLLPTTSWEADYNTSPRTLTSWWRERRRQQKYAWYNSIYRLRFRTGIWTAAFLASWVIVASSQYVASEVLWPTVSDEAWDDVSMRLRVCEVINQQENSKLPPQYCGRTMAAWLAGIISMILCASAILMHATARYCSKRNQRRPFMAGINDEEGDVVDEGDGDGAGIWSTAMVYDESAMTAWERVVAHHQRNRRLPLHTEIFLSVILSVLTGFNAVFVTGVQGPASTVGNLYYASWLTYLLCVRIALGCLEEYYNLSEDDHLHSEPTTPFPAKADQEEGLNSTCNNIDGRTKYKAPSIAADNAGSVVQMQELGEKANHLVNPVYNRAFSIETTGSGTTVSQDNHIEKARIDRVRSYFFLGVFSTACAASAYDAASNNGEGKLSNPQLFMIFAPCFVAVQSVLLFGLSLSKRCYRVVSIFPVGGVFSVVAFGLWLGNLILTMHSSDSWAVNRIGEIKMANLYYFSWASILTAGVQMSSYLKELVGHRKYDIMSIVWATIVKVCFVILGAALHIWHTISGNCGFDEITTGAVSFCSRTVLAIIIALTGMAVGGLVVLGRMLSMSFPRCRCNLLQAHVEMLISLFLVLLFGTAVALITGIGGPGQSVGDLYYSTWLAFLFSFGAFVSCYGEISTSEHREDETPVTKTATNDGTSVLV
ncbi:hypothetical protein FisN_29Lh089 [Fistulifera solaris]|uniref:Uncharacterized protein n=1 Tax=Fistulifera solaris TaxID=1519565 RepID=A0A1Z5JLI2_FISSO|nr:hypothetical protein FisN_29Lh089 [Fistulifera solaris]|eukprot:GAX14877.1 hypothetical protein FisN_29Lh089 [Fistulifera solaris]